jgi:hypothetical protein
VSKSTEDGNSTLETGVQILDWRISEFFRRNNRECEEMIVQIVGRFQSNVQIFQKKGNLSDILSKDGRNPIAFTISL